MLVLSRKDRQKIILLLPDGERVVITLVSGHLYRARIGIEAPENVEIIREELLPSKVKKKENGKSN